MTIRLEYLIPLPLLDQQRGESEVWETSRLNFEPGLTYLVGAPSGPSADRNDRGLGIPVDLAFAFHILEAFHA